MTLYDYVVLARRAGASDIHLIANRHPMLRIDGLLKAVEDDVVSVIDVDRIAVELVGIRVESVIETGEIDLAESIADVRCRISLFRRQGTWSLSIRLLADVIPELNTLGLPEVVKEFPKYTQGLVLVTGRTGSGKTTTIAALLNIINHTECKHILTLEDPVEYLYPDASCAVNQREVGRDTHNFASGLRAALREDPDVILVGELRDYETMEVAITAAETGHLVFSTVHANSAASTIERIVGVFPADRQRQIRLQLSMSLKAVMCQQLLPKAGGGRVVACEVMRVIPKISELIRAGKTPELVDAIKESASFGNILMDKALKNLCTSGAITSETYQTALGELDQGIYD